MNVNVYDERKDILTKCLALNPEFGSEAWKALTRTQPTDDDLAIINQLADSPLDGKDVYIRWEGVANNRIDRDTERFTGEALDVFRATAVNRSVIPDHRFMDPPWKGRIFATKLQEVGDVMWLVEGFYLLRATDERVIAQMAAGLMPWSSIGYRKTQSVPIGENGEMLDDTSAPDAVIHHFDVLPIPGLAEQVELSKVTLGAQYGAGMREDLLAADYKSLVKLAQSACEDPWVKNLVQGADLEGAEPEEAKPYPNEHSCRMEQPAQFEKFNRKTCAQKHDGKCIDVIYGIKDGKSKIQALRYKTGVWTAQAAKAHCAGRKGTFEAASKSEEDSSMKLKLAEGLKAVEADELTEVVLEDGKVLMASDELDALKAKLPAEGAKVLTAAEHEKLTAEAKAGRKYRESLVTKIVNDEIAIEMKSKEDAEASRDAYGVMDTEALEKIAGKLDELKTKLYDGKSQLPDTKEPDKDKAGDKDKNPKPSMPAPGF
jgi:hypothetical protein